jgi:hypothetical protein
MTIKILDEAENDVLGRYFLDSILSDIESLHIYAGIHVVISGYYRLLSKRFPTQTFKSVMVR